MSADGAPAPDDRLSGYLDGELDATERAAVDALLAESPDWRAVLAEVRWTRGALRRLPWHEAPTGFWDEVAVERLGAAAPHRGRHPLRVVAAAAAAAAVTVMFVPVEERDPGGGDGGGGSSPAATVTSFPSLPDRSSVQSESGSRGGGDSGLVRDLINTALDPFDW